MDPRRTNVFHAIHHALPAKEVILRICERPVLIQMLLLFQESLEPVHEAMVTTNQMRDIASNVIQVEVHELVEQV